MSCRDILRTVNHRLCARGDYALPDPVALCALHFCVHCECDHKVIILDSYVSRPTMLVAGIQKTYSSCSSIPPTACCLPKSMSSIALPTASLNFAGPQTPTRIPLYFEPQPDRRGVTQVQSRISVHLIGMCGRPGPRLSPWGRLAMYLKVCSAVPTRV